MRRVFPGPVTVRTLQRDWGGQPQRQEMREQVECSHRSGGRELGPYVSREVLCAGRLKAADRVEAPVRTEFQVGSSAGWKTSVESKARCMGG